MRNRLLSVLCGSALFMGLALTSANASESRLFTFAISCTGSAQLVTLNAGGLGAAATRFVQSAEISIFDNPAALSFIVLEALTDVNKTLLTLGKGQTNSRGDFTGFYSVGVAGGVMPFTLVGACTGGGVLQGLVNIGFFS